MKNILMLFCVLAFATNVLAQNAPEKLPDFKIFTAENKSFTQDDVADDTFSFFIYFNPDCGHCKTAYKTLNLNVENLKNEKLNIYPVSAGNAAETLAFFKNYAPKLLKLENVKILIDDDYLFAGKFFVSSYPSFYMFDKNQSLVSAYKGQDNATKALEDIK